MNAFCTPPNPGRMPRSVATVQKRRPDLESTPPLIDSDMDHKAIETSPTDVKENKSMALGDTIIHLRELLNSVRDSSELDGLHTAISSLNQSLVKETYGEDNRPALQYHLAKALLTRVALYWWMGDLDACFRHFQGAKAIVDGQHSDDKLAGIEVEAELVEECRRSLNIDALNDIISQAESAISLYIYQSSTPASQTAELLIILGNAITIKYLNQGGSDQLGLAATRYQEAERLCTNDISLTYLTLTSFVHVESLRFLEAGETRALPRMHEYSVRATAVDMEALKSLQLGGKAFMGRSDEAQLEKAISLLTTSLQLRLAPHPRRSSSVYGLSEALLTRFRLLQDPKDLEDCIALKKELLSLCPKHHPDRGLALGLSVACLYRFQLLNTTQDLDDSIAMCKEQLKTQSKSYPNRPSFLNNLISSLLMRFNNEGRVEDLEEAVSFCRDLVSSTPPSHPNRILSLNSLSSTLHTRFQHKKSFEDLDECVQLHQEALALLPTSDTRRAMSLNNFANVLSTRFEQKSSLEDLNNCIQHRREALSLQPPSHQDRFMLLNNLACDLCARYQQTQGLHDLDESITLQREAQGLKPTTASDRYMLPYNLGHALYMRFQREGAFRDLEESISLHQMALSMQSLTHSKRCSSLTGLGRALYTRFREKGTSQDLEECIALYKVALELPTTSHHGLSSCLTNLANAFFARFEQRRALQDLEECIAHHRKALDLRPAPHADRHISLINLGHALSTRFGHSGDPLNVQESIALQKEALLLIPQTHYRYPTSLHNLASALGYRFQITLKPEDLEECISLYEQLLSLLTDHHPFRRLLLHNLGTVHLLRFHHQGDDSDIENALYFFEKASKYETGSLVGRLQSAKAWISAASRHRPELTLNAYHYAMELLPLLASLDLTLQQRKDVLEQARDLVGNAAKCAIDANELEVAVIFLSTGRSIFWAQALQLRAPIDELMISHPEIANRYATISKQLEKASYSGNSLLESPIDSTKTVDEYSSLYNLADQRRQIIDEIRSIPNYEAFLLPPSFSSLQPAANEGPIIFLSASELGCDLLIMRRTGTVEHVLLPDISFEQLKDLDANMHLFAKGGQRSPITAQDAIGSPDALSERDMNRVDQIQSNDGAFRSILMSLWDKVIHPVVAKLGLEKADTPTRIWWCPTGPFVSLPIHAAGVYSDDNQPIDCIFHYAVSSYCTSPQDLLHSPPTQAAQDFIMTAILEPETPGQEPLPATRAELDAIEQHIPDSKNLTKHIGSRDVPIEVDGILPDIQRSSFVHFGCHGTQDLDDPLESHLCLSGGTLTMHKIIKECQVHKGAFAYLSACETAKSDRVRPDESLNLAATMIFAGFRSVVGTMWSIFDDDAPIVANCCYRHLFRHGKDAPPDARDAAYGIHLATKELREQGKSFRSWVPFVHWGI